MPPAWVNPRPDTVSCGCVMIHDTRSGNRSCDGSGDLSPTFSMFVYVCLCLFTYVWSLDLFWKLYIVPTLRELTSLSFNINHDTLILSWYDLPLSFPVFICAPPHLHHLPTPSDLICLPSATSTPTLRCTRATVLCPCSD